MMLNVPCGRKGQLLNQKMSNLKCKVKNTSVIMAAEGTAGKQATIAPDFSVSNLIERLEIYHGWLVGYNFLARKTSRVSGISETLVCTVKYCTVDSIADAKLSILVRPMRHVERSGYYGGSP